SGCTVNVSPVPNSIPFSSFHTTTTLGLPVSVASRSTELKSQLVISPPAEISKSSGMITSTHSTISQPGSEASVMVTQNSVSSVTVASGLGEVESFKNAPGDQL